MSVTLDTLAAGARATVTGYAAGDPPGRLLEMGLVPGTTVEVVRLAPLGDPMDLRVRGFHLSVRKQEAAHVIVTPA
ncbi:FeoA family protein [Rubrivirga sp. S365]|uniref:FeoA family protein n=1 Tax=Rubrivirga litoralis TaxID=3075598 RepID=A0ABU3BTT5_9BACT|nr:MULTISPECIES: FeoA family protein [unclassified Rubrivirga]MDT0632695.1 FeoA family protein [Rubrivirga sp. F394]MDT7857839.1 FeoA family protein [Rubrivirga sp. S365]